MVGMWQVKWIERNMRMGEDQLSTVKRRELRRGGVWSVRVYKGSEVEWGVGVGELCVSKYCKVWFTHCLVYLVVFNSNSSTLGSTRFWGLIVYNTCSWCFCNFAYWRFPCVLYVILCDERNFVWCVTVFYCIVLDCIVLSCLSM